MSTARRVGHALGLLALLYGQAGELEVTYRVEVTTVAGSGRVGYKGGAALEAALNRPNGITVAKDGTIYFSDDNNHCVRKVTSDGRVVLVAGSPRTAGFEEGNAEEALFNSPHGLVLDPAGNLYVCDYGNHAIRKVTPSGQVITIAGGNGPGFEDGPAKQARFFYPIAIVRDSRGNLWVLESGNHALRKLTPQGKVVTVAGNGSFGYKDGVGRETAFNSPVGLAIDKQDNLYIVDAGNRAIRRVTPEGHVSTLVDLRFRGWTIRGSLTGGLSFATIGGGQGGGVTVDPDGNLYIADGGMHCIYQVNVSQKTVEILAGVGRPGWIDGQGRLARFYEPVEITIGEKPNVFYVCDYRNAAIRRIVIEKLEKYRKPLPPAIDTTPPSPPLETPSAPKPVTLRLRVIDGTTQKPIPQASLTLKGPKANYELTTGSDGEVSITLPPERYQIRAAHKAYEPFEKAIQVTGDDALTLTLVPKAKVPSLRLVVLDEKTQQPISGARVRVSRGADSLAGGTTGVEGTFQADLAPGSYELEVNHKGYFPHTQTVSIQASQQLTIVLKPAEVGQILRETRILFKPRSPELAPASYPTLDKITDFLKQNPAIRLKIHGHTDIGDPDPNYNKRLSEDRAANVRAYLIRKGIAPERLIAVGHGNTQPIADNSTEEGRALNRRVEFEVIAP